MNLFYRNLLNRRVSEGSEREGKGKESRDADVTRHSQKQGSSVEVTKSAETGNQEYAAHGSRSMPEVSRRRPSPSPEHGGTHRKTASSPSTDANQRGRLSSSEVHDSPDQEQHPKSPSDHLAVEETPSAGDGDATVSKPLSKEDQKLAAEIVRKRRAEQRNDEHSVSAARARYLARKKAKQTAVSKTDDVP